MIYLVIQENPVPWAAHKGYGRRSYNPRFKERQSFQRQIKSQFMGERPISSPVRLELDYYLPIPKYFGKAKRQEAIEGVYFHIVKPDLDNLNKFTVDCLKEIVILDDNQVVEMVARKNYSSTPRTTIRVDILSVDL